MKRHKRYIGGFFGLEQGVGKSPACHPGALALCSGRSCLNFILSQVAAKKVFVPFFCCDALLQPLHERGIACQFYGVDAALEIDDALQLKEGEYIIYINYFGIKSKYCSKLSARYGDRLILDHTQAFFERGPERGWSFNSARKFFGVPDGAYLYGPGIAMPHLERNPHYSSEHLLAKTWGDEADAYSKFLAYEEGIRSDIYRVSSVSEGLLSTVDMAAAKKKRIKNFNRFHKAFKKDNLLKFEAAEDGPSAYPLLLAKKLDKSLLHRQRIFIPTFWNDVLHRKEDGFDYETYLSAHLLPLPVDHRYDKRDCTRVIEAVQALM
jgi:hypothetical protein